MMTPRNETVTETTTDAAGSSSNETPLANAPCFIEQQFPVAKASMESYAERRANQAQSITSLGKWWGRKPLVLVRATLLGLLLPSSDDPAKDREVFLKLMTMDDEGLWRRKDKSIPSKRLLEELGNMPPSIQRQFLDISVASGCPPLRRMTASERQELQRIVFERMPYSEKLEYCCRPEEIEGPSASAWEFINTHLSTRASSLQELVEELGRRRFGHRPRVGDSFCGAGSVPFEAARLGSDVYGSDLSPVAALLTWAALNIVGGGQDVIQRIQDSQQRVYEAAERQLLEWGLDQNEQGWRIDAMLYCTETVDPESRWVVPLSPHWVVAPTSRVVAHLVPNENAKRYEIELIQNASDEQIAVAGEAGTIRDLYLIPPDGSPPTPISAIRRDGRGGIRLWEATDVEPRPDDVFQERLYCIRWIETYYERKVGTRAFELTVQEAESLPNYTELLENGELKKKTRRHYRAPTQRDLEREQKVLDLLRERFNAWQLKGYIPKRKIEPGVKTTEPIRTRGWTYWHHLFTPRQLLTLGLLQEMVATQCKTVDERVANLLSVGRFADWNSKLCRWGTGAARESIGQTFSNQALNTLVTFASKGLTLASGTWFMNLMPETIRCKKESMPADSRTVNANCDVWITDPPYADAIVYHELTEYFLAWYEGQLKELFPGWYDDSKRALAVQGTDQSFRKSMVECYQRLSSKMTDNGLQVVMFTHQEPSVWADLATILWAAGLHVTAAWCIQTEREAAGVRVGNYVQGTVLMVLRKRLCNDPVFLDEVNHRIESEVREQLDSMLALEDNSDPNFADADYQLAAYAAALRVLTERPIEEIDPAREISRQRPAGEISPIEQLIRSAVKIACDHLVPRKLSITLRQYLLEIREQLRGLLDGIETLVLGRVDPDGSGWA